MPGEGRERVKSPAMVTPARVEAHSAAERGSGSSLASWPCWASGDGLSYHRRAMIDRRRFLQAVSVSLLTVPLASEAQRAARVATVGVLGNAVGRNHLADAFEQSLQDLGWVVNQNIKIEMRYAAGKPEALAPLAAELVGLGVDVLVAWTGPGAVAAKRATSHIPVVFLAAGDPVRFGLVSSLARPAGNITGVSFDASLEIDVKRLELLKMVVPGLARVALLVPSDTPRRMHTATIIAAAKQALSLEVREIEVREPADSAAAIRRAKEQGAQALSVWASSFHAWGRQHSELAVAHRLPSIHWFRESAIAGGLLSYAPSLVEIARRGAAYVDRILKGAKPADLPVEQPTKFELVINLKTAKALGLIIPRSLLLQADQVIE
jgi:putative tryptophan/tyrosine transport system substrate-binding protein